MTAHVLAQVTGGLSIIEDSIQQLEAVQQAWDDRWQEIFTQSNGLYLGRVCARPVGESANC